MCKGSVTAQNLYRRAKAGRRLSEKEIELIECYAKRMREVVGEDNREVEVPAKVLAGTLVPIPPELLLHGCRAVLTLRSAWLADTVTGSVVGKYVSGPDTLTLFPNPVVLVNDLARMLKRFQPPSL